MLARNPDYTAVTQRTSDGTDYNIASPSGTRFNITRSTSRRQVSCSATAEGFANADVECAVSGNNNHILTAYITKLPAYYYRFNSTDCATDDDDCYSLVWVSDTSGPNGTDERQNFAIWYSFYRDRGLATISASHQAFYDMSAAVRITWQGLTDCTTLNSNNNTAKCQDNRFRAFGNQHKGNFYSWLRGFQFVGGTPLRSTLARAGEFLRTDSDA